LFTSVRRNAWIRKRPQRGEHGSDVLHLHTHSFRGGFFVVAPEAISVGDIQIALPGVGAYVARVSRNATFRLSAGRSSR